MNKKLARRITESEAIEMFPKWFIEIVGTAFRMLKGNSYLSFETINNFIRAAIEYKPEKQKEIKHIKVKCTNKGGDAIKQHLTVSIYVKPTESDTFFLYEKSVTVRLIENANKKYD